MTQASQFFTYNQANIAHTDLGIIDECLDALFSNNSGPGPPSNPVPGMSWFDTNLPGASGGLLKHRDNDNAEWYAIFSGSSTFRIWVCLDSLTAEEGWVRVTTIGAQSVEDIVLGLKGSSRYTLGGYVSGSWEVGGLTVDSHLHAAGTLKGPSHTHLVPHDGWTSSGPNLAGELAIGTGSDIGDLNGATADQASGSGGTGSVTGSTGSTADTNVTSDQSWSIKAAVGIMVAPDM
jgi:hypothetical protein